MVSSQKQRKKKKEMQETSNLTKEKRQRNKRFRKYKIQTAENKPAYSNGSSHILKVKYFQIAGRGSMTEGMRDII